MPAAAKTLKIAPLSSAKPVLPKRLPQIIIIIILISLIIIVIIILTVIIIDIVYPWHPTPHGSIDTEVATSYSTINTVNIKYNK